MVDTNTGGLKFCSETPIFQRQKKTKKYYARNGAAIYISNVGSLLRNNKILNGSIAKYVMPASRSIDIDTPDDLLIAEAIKRFII